jgi:hypothetical protein
MGFSLYASAALLSSVSDWRITARLREQPSRGAACCTWAMESSNWSSGEKVRNSRRQGSRRRPARVYDQWKIVFAEQREEGLT